MNLLEDIKDCRHKLLLFSIPDVSFEVTSWKLDSENMLSFSALGILNNNKHFLGITLADWAISHGIILYSDT